jgi:hypothetical protein
MSALSFSSLAMSVRVRMAVGVTAGVISKATAAKLPAVKFHLLMTSSAVTSDG